MAVEFGSMALPPVPSGVQRATAHDVRFRRPDAPDRFLPSGITFRPSPRITIDCSAAVSAAGGIAALCRRNFLDLSESSRSQPPDRSGIVAAGGPPCAGYRSAPAGQRTRPGAERRLANGRATRAEKRPAAGGSGP